MPFNHGSFRWSNNDCAKTRPSQYQLRGHLWLPIDQMIFIGAGGYYQEIDKTILSL